MKRKYHCASDSLRPGQLDALINKLLVNEHPNKSQICGHLLTDIITSDEGTGYCSKCEQENKEKLND